MYSCSSGFVLEIGDAVVCNLDLFFQHRYTLGKIIVGTDFTGQLFNFCIGHGLRGGHPLLCAPLPGKIGNNNADKAQPASNQRNNKIASTKSLLHIFGLVQPCINQLQLCTLAHDVPGVAAGYRPNVQHPLVAICTGFAV